MELKELLNKSNIDEVAELLCKGLQLAVDSNRIPINTEDFIQSLDRKERDIMGVDLYPDPEDAHLARHYDLTEAHEESEFAAARSEGDVEAHVRRMRKEGLDPDLAFRLDEATQDAISPMYSALRKFVDRSIRDMANENRLYQEHHDHSEKLMKMGINPYTIHNTHFDRKHEYLYGTELPTSAGKDLPPSPEEQVVSRILDRIGSRDARTGRDPGSGKLGSLLTMLRRDNGFSYGLRGREPRQFSRDTIRRPPHVPEPEDFPGENDPGTGGIPYSFETGGIAGLLERLATFQKKNPEIPYTKYPI